MYLVKRNKLYHLYYKNEQGKLISQSTKCSKKADAQQYMLNYFNKPQSEEVTIQPYTYEKFKVFYQDYASARFSKSYQAFVKIAFSQFEKVIDPTTEIGCRGPAYSPVWFKRIPHLKTTFSVFKNNYFLGLSASKVGFFFLRYDSPLIII